MREVKKNKALPQNIVDRVVTYINPKAGAERLAYRMRMGAVAGGYNSGNRNRSAMRNWKRSNGSADSEILPSLQSIRSDSRDLQRNAPLAKGAINTVVTNVVGTGLSPQSDPDRQILRERGGLSDEQIERFIRQAESAFRRWSLKRGCDASLCQTFSSMQGLVLRSVLEAGDIFAIRRFISRPGYRYKTAIQLIEADRVDNPFGQTDKPELTAGIKRDTFGAPIAYHILKEHPGNRQVGAKRESIEFPAFMENGEWQVLHLFKRERPEQTRGVPYLAPVVEILKQLDRYTEAEINAAVISGAFTVFITSEDDGEDSGLNVGEGSSGKGSSQADINLGNGLIVDLAKGEKPEFANPSRPNQAFDPFVMAVLRQIGVALELPFEVLVKHFTASYSAAQAAILEAWKFFRERRKWLADSFCQPSYEAVIAEAVAMGDVIAPGFFSDPILREAYLETEWIGPPRGVIDPLKEAKANEIMEDRGWKTAGEITAEMTGGDWDKKHERRQKEQEMRSAIGIAVGQPPVSEDNPSNEEGNNDYEGN